MVGAESLDSADVSLHETRQEAGISRMREVERFLAEPHRETQYTHIDENPGTAWAKKETMR